MAMGTEGNTDAPAVADSPQTDEKPTGDPAQVREVIAAPSRRADGSVTHSDDAVIPDPDGYAEAAAAQIKSMSDVDDEKAVELGRAEATRSGQKVETTDAAPAAAPATEQR